MKILAAVLLMLFTNFGDCRENSSVPRQTKQQGVNLLEAQLCRTPRMPCVPVSYKTKFWFNCRNASGGCYEKTFIVTLQAGRIGSGS